MSGSDQSGDIAPAPVAGAPSEYISIDDADNLMSGNDRKLAVAQVAVDEVEVGTAHAARADADADFAGQRDWNFTIRGRQALRPRAFEHHRSHGVPVV